LKTALVDIYQFMLSPALNFVNKKDKNFISHFKHSKLSQKHSKNMLEN